MLYCIIFILFIQGVFVSLWEVSGYSVSSNFYITKCNLLCPSNFHFRNSPFIYKRSGDFTSSLFKRNDLTVTFLGSSGSCRTRTSRSDCCVFPFIYQGRRYNSCTRVRSRRPWCSLTSSYDKDKLYGYCGGTKRKISFLTGSWVNVNK